jgi:hypothetical protein
LGAIKKNKGNGHEKGRKQSENPKDLGGRAVEKKGKK